MENKVNKNSRVERFFAGIPGPFIGLAADLRALVKAAAPQAREEVKWGFPCYSQNGLLCYIRPVKAHLTLGFYKGSHLSDPGGRLEGTGKGLRHVKIRRAGNIQPELFTRWVREAVEMNSRGEGER